jgi:hypothetical protein
MKNLISIGSIAVVSLALNLVTFQSAQAASLVSNGDFNINNVTNSRYLGGDSNGVSAATATGWTFGNGGLTWLVKTGTTYTQNLNLDQNNTDLTQKMYGSAPITSPNGTANWFVVADGDSNYNRTISQTLNGLEVGQRYDVSFYQAAGQQFNYTGGTTERWQVSLGSSSQFSALMSPVQPFGPGEDAFDTNGTQIAGGTATAVSAWQPQTLTFTAGAQSEVLSFLAKGTPDGKPPFALLAGVAATKQLPEPADYLGTLFGAGCLGFAVKSRLVKKKLADRD